MREWNEDKHLTAFAIRLHLEQKKLLANGITITDADKNAHYILEMWNSK